VLDNAATVDASLALDMREWREFRPHTVGIA